MAGRGTRRENDTMRYPLSPHTMTTRQESQDLCPCIPQHTRFNLDGGRSQELGRFYGLVQQHREFYRDKSGTLYPVPYFVLPMKEKERCPHPLDLPPLSAKTRWHLLRLSSLDVRTCQTFPSGKRVPPQERQNRDVYFACRA
ncbi:ciliary microtubule inner protein 2C [Columba livia]|uniref:ciliary microtubule inner protein 2C n=1 Tax=Columba livia TaxID=8932 RepID=UPI0031BB37D8